MGTGELNAGGNPAMDWHPIQGGVEILLVASCYGNRDKLLMGLLARMQTLPLPCGMKAEEQNKTKTSTKRRIKSAI